MMLMTIYSLLNGFVYAKAGRLFFLLAAAAAVLYLIDRGLGMVFSDLLKKQSVTYRSRLATILSVLKSLVGFLVVFIFFLVIISDFGFNIGPLLAGAGIFGLAISFGAQTLVRDIIAGFFLIVENQINVGDSVKIDESKGRIVKMQLRSIVLRDEEGNLVYIPNSEIKRITVLRSP